MEPYNRVDETVFYVRPSSTTGTKHEEEAETMIWRIFSISEKYRVTRVALIVDVIDNISPKKPIHSEHDVLPGVYATS
ncbi:hypothetical protein RRG08_054442 [Elysia crispata]|uniref:Uncharacterized protein n=1 Tax=Elysia crispata TaxID=231223 RepID=A0AAE1E6N1_9GAST|nr:hypothetical protein RRG08_054442 [Elysia crispata]